VAKDLSLLDSMLCRDPLCRVFKGETFTEIRVCEVRAEHKPD